MVIKCKTVDDIRQALYDITGEYRMKRGQGIMCHLALNGVSDSTLYRFMGGRGKCGIRIHALVSTLNAFGYTLAIVKAGDEDESKNS